MVDQCYAFDALLGPAGWLSPGYVQVDEHGVIRDVATSPGAGIATTNIGGIAIPGMPNVHSHAFQRAIAGRTEFRGGRDDDSFWSWRQAMYSCALRVTPEQLRAIATWCYVEMLEAGMTSVGEFHYLHHQPDGTRYDEPAELALQTVAAADDAGIAMTCLPVLYSRGGFGRPPESQQRRFVHDDADAYFELVRRVACERGPHLRRVGIAPHSLRAVAADDLEAVVARVRAVDKAAPIHMHVAEQAAEVEACIEHLGARPVRWLLDHVGVDSQWCLVHATHVEPDEVTALAASGATVGLCTTTEANLGDGHFPLPEYLAKDGALAIGSDSQIEIDPCAELRWAEYEHRLLRQRRAVLTTPSIPHLGRRLWERCAAGGASALDQATGVLAPGLAADLVVLDAEHERLTGMTTDLALDAFVFSAGKSAVRDVMVGGVWQVRGGAHRDRARLLAEFRHAMGQLWESPHV